MIFEIRLKQEKFHSISSPVYLLFDGMIDTNASQINNNMKKYFCIIWINSEKNYVTGTYNGNIKHSESKLNVLRFNTEKLAEKYAKKLRNLNKYADIGIRQFE